MTSSVISIFSICEAFKNSSKHVMRGENGFRSGHVKKVIFDSSVSPMKLSGEVQASMKKTNYTVEISYDAEDGIKDMKCTCPRGQVLCHHMAALLFYGHYNISATDVACRWSAPKHTANDERPKTLQDMHPPKKHYRATNRELTSEDIEEFRSNLGPATVVGFSWLLKPEVEQVFLELVPSIETILYSEEYINTSNKDEYFLRKCALTNEAINIIAEETVGQHLNEKWLISRKMRLTSSKFGAVLAACKRDKYPPSLFKSLFEGYNLNRALAIQWGKDNENTALKKFEEITNVPVIPTGMWFDKSGFLAASPDGLIGDDAVLEIKCPYTYRSSSLKAGVSNRKYFFYYEDGNIVIKTDHPYYHQVQGQLHMTNRKKCYFFVWTPQEYEVFEVVKDENWGPNIETLRNIYMNKFIPNLIN